MSVSFKCGIGRLITVVLVALASCSGDLPSTAWRGGPGERGYSAGPAIPIVDLIRERDIRPPDQAAAVPLLEQVGRELAKSDPDGTVAGITYDLTAGNRLPPAGCFKVRLAGAGAPLTCHYTGRTVRIANPMSGCRPAGAMPTVTTAAPAA